MYKRDGGYFGREFKNGFPNGQGIKRWRDGTEYEGNFVEGKEMEKGVKKWEDGQQ